MTIDRKGCGGCADCVALTMLQDDARGGWLWLGLCQSAAARQGLVTDTHTCPERRPIPTKESGNEG